MDLLLKMPVEYEPLRKNRFLLRFPSDLGMVGGIMLTSYNYTK